MSFIDHQIQEPDLKSEITSYILDDLPNWFGIEAAKKEYIENVRDKDFFVIHKKKEPEFKPNSPLGEELNFSEIEKIKSSLGFITLKYHSQYSAEVYVMGILKKYHRLGIGKKLIDTVSAHLKEHSYKFLTVKTLSPNHPDPNYTKTRAFYKSVDFLELEEFSELWGKENPCLMMIKSL